MVSKETGYISFDVETDGPSPLKHSLLSLGMVLFDNEGNEVDSLSVNIMKRNDAVENPSTMEFWAKNKEAWDHCHKDMLSPLDAMNKVSDFYSRYSSKYSLKWIAMPSCFDWMFLKSYFDAYSTKGVNIGFKCDCISSIRDQYMKTKGLSWKDWDSMCEKLPKGDHFALADARFQGLIYFMIQN